MLASLAIKADRQGSPDQEYWQSYKEIIETTDLTPAQLLGLAINIADSESLRNLLEISRSINKATTDEQTLRGIIEILVAYIGSLGNMPEIVAPNSYLLSINKLECAIKSLRLAIGSLKCHPEANQDIDAGGSNNARDSLAMQTINALEREANKLAFKLLLKPTRPQGGLHELPVSAQFFTFDELELAMDKDASTAYHIRESIPKLERLTQYILDDAKIIVDCGAHVGIFSALAAAKHRNASFYLFEPNKDMNAYIDYNMPARSTYYVYNAGVGGFRGNSEFFKSNQSSQTSSFIERSTLHFSRRDGITKQNSAICMLSDFIVTEGIEIDFLKIDIQGKELEVIQDLVQADVLQQVRTIAIESSHLDAGSIKCVDYIMQTEIYPQAFLVNPVYGGGDIVFSRLDFASVAEYQNAYQIKES